MRKSLAMIIALTIGLLGLTACAESQPHSERPVTTITPDTSSPTPTPSATETEAVTENEADHAYSDEEIRQNQLAKFDYLQDPLRIQRFEDSGYDVAKVKIAMDIMDGDFGEALLEVDDSGARVNVGDPDDPTRLYAWFFSDVNEEGTPDFSSVWNIAIQVPGHDYVEIDDTVHDWPTEIDGYSAELKYNVSVGSSRNEPVQATCLWPEFSDEKEFCYGDGPDGDAATKTYADASSADELALQTMELSMDDLYPNGWRKG